MDETELTARLREIQVSLNIYIKKFESFEQELSHLKNKCVAIDTNHLNYSESIKEFKSAVESLKLEISNHKDKFNQLHLEVSNHLVSSSKYSNAFDKIADTEDALQAGLQTCERQITELVHTTHSLQDGLTELSEMFEKLDETVTKNDLLIGKLNFTLRTVIGLISGLVAVIGTAIAGWDYLVDFFAK